jgi:hypothetical protein
MQYLNPSPRIKLEHPLGGKKWMKLIFLIFKCIKYVYTAHTSEINIVMIYIMNAKYFYTGSVYGKV